MAKEQPKEEVVVEEKQEPAKKPVKEVKAEVPAGAKVTTLDNGTVRTDY